MEITPTALDSRYQIRLYRAHAGRLIQYSTDHEYVPDEEEEVWLVDSFEATHMLPPNPRYQEMSR
jgi:hypothetical protein